MVALDTEECWAKFLKWVLSLSNTKARNDGVVWVGDLSWLRRVSWARVQVEIELGASLACRLCFRPSVGICMHVLLFVFVNVCGCVWMKLTVGGDVLAKEMAGGMAGFRLWMCSVSLLLSCLLSCLGYCFSIANGLSVQDWRNGLVDTTSHLSVWDWRENQTRPVPSCREPSCSALRLWDTPCVGPRRCCSGPSAASVSTSEVWGTETFLDMGLAELVSAFAVCHHCQHCHHCQCLCGVSQQQLLFMEAV